MAEKSSCWYLSCNIEGYCPHTDPAYLAGYDRVDKEYKEYFAKHPRPPLSSYVDASSDEEDAMVVEESGLPSPPVSPRDTNNNTTTGVNGNATQACRLLSHHSPTTISRATRVQSSGIHKARRCPGSSGLTRSTSFLPLFMLLTNKLPEG